MQVIGQATCALEALDLFCTLVPDVLVMEADLPLSEGIKLIRTLTKRFPAACILVLSYHEEEEIIFQALQAGAKGYYVQDTETEELVNAVRRVCKGERAVSAYAGEKLASRSQRQPLTRREMEVLSLLVAGQSNQEVAANLFVAEGTVKIHVSNLLHKLGVPDRTQAVVTAFQKGFVLLS